MSTYFKVKVQFEIDNGKKTKNINREYIVNAVSPTEAEIVITKYLTTDSVTGKACEPSEPFEVKACVATKIEAVLND